MSNYLKGVNGNTYSVLEANFLAARRTGQVKAQLPLAGNVDTVENGMFLVYDMQAGEVKLPSGINQKGMMLHFSVEKEYDNLRPGLHNYAIHRHGATGKLGTPYPRLFQVHIGDTFTTDAVKLAAETEDAFDALTLGHVFGIGNDGFIDATSEEASADGVRVRLIAKTTLPDGGLGCKFEVEHVA